MSPARARWRPREWSRRWSRQCSSFAAPAAWLAGTSATPAWAQYAADYTYVKMSLTVPWTLYFVFLAGVLIPFVVMIVKAGHGLTLNRFLRYVLPVLVVIVLAVVAVFVYNAFEVMHLMETEKRAGPTILSR